MINPRLVVVPSASHGVHGLYGGARKTRTRMHRSTTSFRAALQPVPVRAL